MENLIPIIEHSDYLKSLNSINDSDRWNLHLKRIDFGKQKLEIWMFVACKLVEGVWVVLEEPEKWNYFVEKSKQSEFFMTNKECVEYQEAKNRVLFEGFKYNENVFNGSFVIANYIKIPVWNMYRETVESLAKYNLKLTPTAKKQLKQYEKQGNKTR